MRRKYLPTLKHSWFAAMAALWLFLAISPGCDWGSTGKSYKPDPEHQGLKFLVSEAPKQFDFPVNESWDGKIELLGFNLEPMPLQHGKPFKATFYFKVLDNLSRPYKFFGHFESLASDEPARQGWDHYLAGNAIPAMKWKTGMIFKDEYQGKIPPGFPGVKADLWAGFFDGNYRMPPDKRQNSDSQDRVKVATIALDKPIESDREAQVFRAGGPITIDGKLDEPCWEKAPSLGFFVNTSGTSKVHPVTDAKLLWDDTNLYVAFTCNDKDVWSTYLRRDDPLYRQEAVEIFIDADGSRSTYYELQVSPANVIFDVYWGSRRRQRNMAWDSKMKTAVSVDGTLNNHNDTDKSYTVEVAIPHEVIEDAPNRPPKPGDVWKANFFRMEKKHNGPSKGSMWSPTMVGDFHALSRFGKLTFMEPSAGDRNVDPATLQKNSKSLKTKDNSKKQP